RLTAPSARFVRMAPAWPRTGQGARTGCRSPEGGPSATTARSPPVPDGWAHRVRRLLLSAVIALTVVGTAPIAAQAEDVLPWEQVLDITFPTRPDARVSDTFDACRDGCTRAHQASDIMGEKMWPLYATVSGEI